MNAPRVLVLLTLAAFSCASPPADDVTDTDAASPDVTPDVAPIPDAAADVPSDVAPDGPPQCPPDFGRCDGGQCVALSAPPNCGACGITCPASESCLLLSDGLHHCN